MRLNKFTVTKSSQIGKGDHFQPIMQIGRWANFSDRKGQLLFYPHKLALYIQKVV